MSPRGTWPTWPAYLSNRVHSSPPRAGNSGADSTGCAHGKALLDGKLTRSGAPFWTRLDCPWLNVWCIALLALALVAGCGGGLPGATSCAWDFTGPAVAGQGVCAVERVRGEIDAVQVTTPGLDLLVDFAPRAMTMQPGTYDVIADSGVLQLLGAKPCLLDGRVEIGADGSIHVAGSCHNDRTISGTISFR